MNWKRFLLAGNLSYMKYWPILAIIPSFLFAADYEFAGTAIKRHQEMCDHYNQQKQIKHHPKYITGDWGGARAELAEKGVTFSAKYTTDFLGNPVGGRSQGFAYTGSLGADLLVNFEKLSSITGWNFYTSVVWRRGTSLTASKIGNQFPVQQVFGGQTFQLDCLYLRKYAFNDRLVLEFGRLNAGDHFLQNDLYYYYVSNAFCGNPVAVFFNNPGFTAYPHATWGAYLRFHPWKRLRIQGGVYNGNSDLQKSKFHGMNFTFRTKQGVQFSSDLTLQVNQESGDTGLPGNYAVGAFLFNRDKPKFLGGTGDGNPGWYIQVDQMLYSPDPEHKRGLHPFAAFLFAPKNRNTFPFFFTSGIVYKGPTLKRAKDAVVLGVAYGKYSKDSNEQRKQQGLEQQSFETVVELNYKYQANQWCFIQPDVQYIINPKGLGKTIPNALAIGAQVNLVF